MVEVGSRIRALREGMGYSLRDLAERSGVSAPMLSQVERGETSPTLSVASKIAAGLELSLSQLRPSRRRSNPRERPLHGRPVWLWTTRRARLTRQLSARA